jgi:hypothetical protein
MQAHRHLLRATSLLCTFLLLPKDVLTAQEGKPPATSQPESAKKIPPDQLDSLVAPIALYPDPLMAQVLAASTYPLEIVQLQQWLEKHKDLKDKALADAVKRENWEPSVQAMAALPDVVKLLTDNVKWCAELGDAFLAQQSDVMEAVQRMRAKAKDSGKLKSNEQMKVETKVIESKQVVVIEQANPQVVYVPSYNPTVVWGAPVYAYPPVYYPPAGYYAAGMAISFGVGVAMGAMWSGGWGWGAGWGGNNDITVNRNNNFNRNSSYNRSTTGSGNRTWQHNPQHRGGAPYGDRATANKYSGSARGDSLSSRQTNARQNVAQRSSGQGGLGNRSSSAGGGDLGNRSGGGGRDIGGNRGGGGDRVGDRQIGGGGGGSRSSSAFDGASRGGGAARSSSSRGASSSGGSRGGGGGRRR